MQCGMGHVFASLIRLRCFVLMDKTPEKVIIITSLVYERPWSRF